MNTEDASVETGIEPIASPLKIVEICQIGEAVLEYAEGWRDGMYRFRKGGLTTGWGLYDHVYRLDGRYYVSPYWGDMDTWVECTAEEALDLICISD